MLQWCPSEGLDLLTYSLTRQSGGELDQLQEDGSVIHHPRGVDQTTARVGTRGGEYGPYQHHQGGSASKIAEICCCSDCTNIVMLMAHARRINIQCIDYRSMYVKVEGIQRHLNVSLCSHCVAVIADDGSTLLES